MTVCGVFFCFKQKTAYEMRISDWSSDVCSSDLIPSQEIRELGEAFRTISRTVALHEADLAEGLIRQTKLTREVHHRVKNNLQVISSLINFHARGARDRKSTRLNSSH